MRAEAKAGLVLFIISLMALAVIGPIALWRHCTAPVPEVVESENPIDTKAVESAVVAVTPWAPDSRSFNAGVQCSALALDVLTKKLGTNGVTLLQVQTASWILWSNAAARRAVSE